MFKEKTNQCFSQKIWKVSSRLEKRPFVKSSRFGSPAKPRPWSESGPALAALAAPWAWRHATWPHGHQSLPHWVQYWDSLSGTITSSSKNVPIGVSLKSSQRTRVKRQMSMRTNLFKRLGGRNFDDDSFISAQNWLESEVERVGTFPAIIEDLELKIRVKTKKNGTLNTYIRVI